MRNVADVVSEQVLAIGKYEKPLNLSRGDGRQQQIIFVGFSPNK